MYVLVAATARSSPASIGRTASLATASGEAGSLVIATVGRPCLARLLDHRLDVGRLARLRDPDDQRTVEPRRLLVQGVERRCRERDRNAVGAPEDVLGVAGRIRRAAARRDQDVLDVGAPEQRRDRLGVGALAVDQPRERLGLLGQFQFEVRAHAGTPSLNRSVTASYDAAAAVGDDVAACTGRMPERQPGLDHDCALDVCGHLHPGMAVCVAHDVDVGDRHRVAFADDFARERMLGLSCRDVGDRSQLDDPRGSREPRSRRSRSPAVLRRLRSRDRRRRPAAAPTRRLGRCAPRPHGAAPRGRVRRVPRVRVSRRPPRDRVRR